MRDSIDLAAAAAAVGLALCHAMPPSTHTSAAVKERSQVK